MSTAEETWRSLARTQEFLEALLDTHRTPRVPLAVRQDARRLLRHYPGATQRALWQYDVETLTLTRTRVNREDPARPT